MYTKLVEIVVPKLWQYIVTSEEDVVIAGALNALTCFEPDEIIDSIPEIYLIPEVNSTVTTEQVSTSNNRGRYLKCFVLFD